jgi:protein SCO1/2
MIAWSTLLRRMVHASVVTVLFTLAACSDSNVKWSLYDVSGHLPNLRFSLQGTGGKTVTEKDFAGQTVFMFFGYASCPDICPTTMAQLTEVVNKLGDRAKDVKIVFISVDPHRDTPDILQAYVKAFSNQVAELARRYRVAYQIEKPKPGDSTEVYDVTHSRGVFIFDRFGRARLLASDTEKVDVVVADVIQLIELTQR